jgi:hypothetical protein
MSSTTLNEFNEAAALLSGFDSYDKFNQRCVPYDYDLSFASCLISTWLTPVILFRDRVNTMVVADCIDIPFLCLNAQDDPLCVSKKYAAI